MASVRAENVAEVLWELKRIDKVATFTEVAGRAGFKPGAAGGSTKLAHQIHLRCAGDREGMPNLLPLGTRDLRKPSTIPRDADRGGGRLLAGSPTCRAAVHPAGA